MSSTNSQLKNPRITNSQVEQLLAMRETQRSLKERVRLMDDALNKAEGDLLAQIDSGADLSACGYELSIQERVCRYPAWKEYFIEKLGKAEADAVLNTTAPTIHRKVVVK